MPAQYKIDEVALLREALEGADAVFITEYRGLSVEKSTELRKAVRDAGGHVRVARNTLMSIALKEHGLAHPDEMMTGPNAYIISYGESPAVAKALEDFAAKKENAALVIKGGVMGESMLDSKAVAALAKLPSKEQLRAQVVGTMVAPLRGLVTVLSGTMRGLVTCLSQLAEKKEKEAA
ncbi:ribosomal protein L10 [Jonquetella anthropi DSM 22815]|uniref:Large ribosomal subunit protein uL10 n=1 Tax=Jonquetella anthropi DSM 22815 TaxID=885272 RepID=H0UL57_9BACT|nr:50S ribosomal protein L10 [Jonquetella anthropi]EHM13416.1 ribosomal protein L10 [Jonquetella anthropi DSM 22815]